MPSQVSEGGKPAPFFLEDLDADQAVLDALFRCESNIPELKDHKLTMVPVAMVKDGRQKNQLITPAVEQVTKMLQQVSQSMLSLAGKDMGTIEIFEDNSLANFTVRLKDGVRVVEIRHRSIPQSKGQAGYEPDKTEMGFVVKKGEHILALPLTAYYGGNRTQDPLTSLKIAINEHKDSMKKEGILVGQRKVEILEKAEDVRDAIETIWGDLD